MVVVSGAPPFEAMAHWHNIELAARVECMRIEEATLEATEVERGDRMADRSRSWRHHRRGPGLGGIPGVAVVDRHRRAADPSAGPGQR